MDAAGEVSCKATTRIQATGGVTAIALKWTYLRANGRSSTGEVSADRGIRPSASPLRLGETLDMQYPLTFKFKAGELTRIEVELEFAVPVVGQPWGDTKSKSYVRMQNMRQGYAQALNYLKSVLASKGADGVIKELQTP